MSPYCPQCLGASSAEEARCPLDQQFLHRRTCRQCHSELFPRELFCAHCGSHCREPQEVILVPPEASPIRAFGAFLLDYLCLGLLVVMVAWSVLGALVLLVGPVLTVLYRAAGRSGGRQTFGQAVFHILTLDERAGPAPFGLSLKRSLLEIWFVPVGLARKSAGAELERKSSTLEVVLA